MTEEDAETVGDIDNPWTAENFEPAMLALENPLFVTVYAKTRKSFDALMDEAPNDEARGDILRAIASMVAVRAVKGDQQQLMVAFYSHLANVMAQTKGWFTEYYVNLDPDSDPWRRVLEGLLIKSVFSDEIELGSPHHGGGANNEVNSLMIALFVRAIITMAEAFHNDTGPVVTSMVSAALSAIKSYGNREDIVNFRTSINTMLDAMLVNGEPAAPGDTPLPTVTDVGNA